ncbi:MAG: hypothetical protein IPG72_12640 [Ardenticatenales bacterium]|nr:hypothetical protein [Ardenticatenales bacterium]
MGTDKVLPTKLMMHLLLLAVIASILSGSAKKDLVLGAPLPGHGGSALCGSTQGSEKCRAARTEILIGDPLITSVVWDMTYPDPCSVDGAVYRPGWLYLGSVASTAPVLEIGVIKVGASGNSVKNEIYICCIRCNSTSYCNGYGALHGDGSAKAQLDYSAATQKWRFFVDGAFLDEVQIASKGIALSFGGEADYWQNDMGILVHRFIHWYDTNQWHEFTPFNTAFEEENYGGRWVTRFRTSPSGTQLGFGFPKPSVSVLSDHHITGETDACGDTP